MCSTTYVLECMAWISFSTLRSTVGCSCCRASTPTTDLTGRTLALISPHRHLPADDASTGEVPSDAWQHKITPHDFYAEVEADPRALKRVQTARAEINEHQVTLAQVRKARAFTQAALAELLEMDQSEVSRLEHRSNMLLSTLRSFIRATGGELQLIATFPDAEPVQLLVGYETSDIDR